MTEYGLYYILKDKKVVPTKNVLVWGKFFEKHSNRRVGWKILLDGTTVSTVFLGMDHAMINESIPVLFETMVFTKAPGMKRIKEDLFIEDKECQRYCTWEQAEEGHAMMVDKYRVKGFSRQLRCLFSIYIPLMIRRTILKIRYHSKRLGKDAYQISKSAGKNTLSAVQGILLNLPKTKTTLHCVNLRRKSKSKIHEDSNRHRK